MASVGCGDDGAGGAGDDDDDLADAGAAGDDDDDVAGTPMTFNIPNIGLGRWEGHTPRGFMGSGTGLFAGDNLNPGFPEGDGVQIFLTFELEDLPEGVVQSATLSSSNASTSGTPFEDLGNLDLEEIRFGGFGPELWNAPVVDGGHTCVFATSAEGPFSCDVTPLVASSRDDAYPFAQMRMRMDRAGDGDGAQDLVQFFLTDSNTNEPGIFDLEVTILVP